MRGRSRSPPGSPSEGPGCRPSSQQPRCRPRPARPPGRGDHQLQDGRRVGPGRPRVQWEPGPRLPEPGRPPLGGAMLPPPEGIWGTPPETRGCCQATVQMRRIWSFRDLLAAAGEGADADGQQPLQRLAHGRRLARSINTEGTKGNEAKSLQTIDSGGVIGGVGRGRTCRCAKTGRDPTRGAFR